MPNYIRRLSIALINAVLTFPLPAQQGSAPTGGAPSATQAPGDQPGEGPQARQQIHRLAVLGQYLGLTEDQKREWMRIQRETGQAVRAARNDSSLNEGQMQQKLKSIHAEQKRQLLALLTPQQQEALKKWWDEQREKQKASGSSPSADVSASNSTSDKGSAKDDDFFSGMVQDDDQPAAPRPIQKNPAPPHR
jgi:hypothetical protein